MIKKTLLFLVSLAMSVPNLMQAADDLAQGFAKPPHEAKPRVYWWWLNNLVSKEGITRDLEELSTKGVGGVLLFSAASGHGKVPDGPDFMSPEWREMVKHAVSEASRLGLEVSINLCSGWDAGGPWITDEAASQHYVQSQFSLTGPQKFSGKIPQPSGDANTYRDVIIQAFPRAANDKRPLVPDPVVTASSAQENHQAQNALDGNEQTMWVSGGWKAGDAPTLEKPEWLQLEFPQPITTKMLRITPRSSFGPRDIEIQTSIDGKTFTSLMKHTLERDGEQVIPLPQTSSRIFRILVNSSYVSENCQIVEAAVTQPEKSAVLDVLAFKAGRKSALWTEPVRVHVESPLAPPPFDPAIQAINPATIIDLTDRLQPDGTLSWDVPAGDWIIVRTGYAKTGVKVSFSTKGGHGLEMDFLAKRGMDLHFKSMADVLLNDSAPLVGKTLKYLHDDSWEVGLPNWTRDFLAEFKKFRGYDALPYLPTLAGYAVGSSEISDRFLHDFRKTIADCIAENHYARFAELARARGVGIHSQSGGPGWPHHVSMDALKNLGHCDIPNGEFWNSKHWKEAPEQNTNGKQTSSAGHIYGKRWIMGEAFTSLDMHWQESPFNLKPTADVALCEGFNRFFLHTSTSTRDEDGKPGYEYFAGTHFNRNVTWWDKATPFIDYISRCQWLLSRGLFVADVLYYNGDGAPNLVEPKKVNPSLGKGYDYDVCNVEVLLTRLSVANGRLVLPDGMSYRLLVLPDRRQMPVEVLEKIRELVKAGATVVGPKPESDPGLKNYPQCDAEVKKIAHEIWGDLDGKQRKERKFGKGQVFWDKTLREILLADGVSPDFEHSGGDAFIDFIHRTVDGTEIYFLANRKNRGESVNAFFRVAGKKPELWDPVTGTRRALPEYEVKDRRTTVPLMFEPHGSMFVVFKKESTPAASGERSKENFPETKQVQEISGSWTVCFDPAWFYPVEGLSHEQAKGTFVFDRLEDWSKRPEAALKHFSGAAVYRKTFDLPQGTEKQSSRIDLNLGVVQDIARVKLNGKDLGVVWCAPWRVEITEAVREKGNELEIEVCNLWPNRLIGDAGLPQEQRMTRTNVNVFKNDSPLLPSGLLGPVTVHAKQ